MKPSSLLIFKVLVAVLGCSTVAIAADGHDHGAPADSTTADDSAATVGDPYTLDACPVTGEKLDSMGDPIIYSYNGREIRFCCAGCVDDFESDPAKYIAGIDAQIVAQQVEYYPLDTCIVAGTELGGMGKPVDYVYNNRLVRFCCQGCVSEFESDPAKYIAEIDAAAVSAQAADYPVDYCLVLPDEKVGGLGTVDYVVGGRLFRLCCEGCKEAILAEPSKYIALLDAAAE